MSLSDEFYELLRICERNASRVNPDSTHRRVLRKLLADNDIAVAELLMQPVVRALNEREAVSTHSETAA